ncbi:hypothetical protein DY000_02012640 [Brassica cretica]|uniref:Uncharacterized protein n=1 Tax=Brassica cretica TaxID=69181 RepID=A0ABQ7D9Q2_BRACR|nr:hypothetical protein DY000_02012640 [Brassica cretica]
MAATKMFFFTWFSSSTHLKVDLSILDMYLFFRSGFGYAGFSDLEDVWDDLHVFNQMVLIFYSFKDLEDFCDDLPVSCLKYNALDEFQEVFQTTSRKFSDEVFFHIKWSPSLSL